MLLVVFLLTFLLILLGFSVLTWRQLVRIHPRRRRAITITVIICSLWWPFLPIFNARTDFSRFVRSLLGPPWTAWITFAIFYSGLLFLVLLVWLPLRRRRRFEEVARWPSRIFIALVIVGGVIGVYQALVPLRVERVPVMIENLPPELDGTRLALVADLHTGLFTRSSRLEKIFATTAALQPHAVFLLGDMLDDDPHYIPKLLAGMWPLPAQTPVFAVLGNHEMYNVPREVMADLRGTRVRLLVNEGAPLGRLWLAGLSDYDGRRVAGMPPDFEAALAHRPPDAFPIVLSHQPNAFDDARRRGLPLTVCGHTHGGQCGIRPLRWSVAGIFLPYHMGLYRRGGSQLYVTTGAGYWMLPFRLGMTPEIALIELRRAEAARRPNASHQ